MRYSRGSEPLEDLFQVASLGLVKAVDGFDPRRHCRFTAYAVPTMLGELRRHFRDHVSSVHLPRGLQERSMEVDRAATELMEQTGRSPTDAEIAAHLHLDREEVIEARRAGRSRRTRSLDAPRIAGEAESGATVDSIGNDERGYDAVEAGMAASEAGLDDREWIVLRLRFGRQLTQDEIGDRLGVSQMHVSRITRRALRKLLCAVRSGEGELTSPA